MITTIITLTSSYQLVGAKGLWTAIQNIGHESAVVVLKVTSAPADTDKGFVLRPLDRVTLLEIGDEDVYVKSKTGAGEIAISI